MNKDSKTAATASRGATPWPLKILYFVLCYLLIAGLTAGIVDLLFGRGAAVGVLTFAEDVAVVIGIALAPVVLVGLLLIPFYLVSMRLLSPSSKGTVSANDPGQLRPLAWLAAVPWSLKILCFVLAYVLVFGLAAWIGEVEFGRNAAERVVIFAEDLSIIIGLVCAPVVLVVVFYMPLYLAARSVLHPTKDGNHTGS
jgi:hypothetical protein